MKGALSSNDNIVSWSFLVKQDVKGSNTRIRFIWDGVLVYIYIYILIVRVTLRIPELKS